MRHLSTNEMIKLSPHDQAKHSAKLFGWKLARQGRGKPSNDGSAWNSWATEGYDSFIGESKQSASHCQGARPTHYLSTEFCHTVESHTCKGCIFFDSGMGAPVCWSAFQKKNFSLDCVKDHIIFILKEHKS